VSRFNTRGHQAKPAVALATSPLGTVSKKAPDTRTFEGGAGWKKDYRTDLFLRATASFHDGSKTFYESGEQRDEKLIELARQAAIQDFTWFARFLIWGRQVANIRTAMSGSFRRTVPSSTRCCSVPTSRARCSRTG
jgi:hypothetical protein